MRRRGQGAAAEEKETYFWITEEAEAASSSREKSKTFPGGKRQLLLKTNFQFALFKLLFSYFTMLQRLKKKVTRKCSFGGLLGPSKN